MSFIKIWIHCVWNTKDKIPVLTKEIRHQLLVHIKEYSINNKIFIDRINGSVEHVHCLISLGNDQNISRIMNLIKGEFSHWINSLKLLNRKLEWQNDYYAISVSESLVNTVRKYIENQEEHHKKKSYKEELNDILKVLGI
ncbi:MAG TPA: IS200/IS605 family transposase [Ignavibacteria bacterium]